MRVVLLTMLLSLVGGCAVIDQIDSHTLDPTKVYLRDEVIPIKYRGQADRYRCLEGVLYCTGAGSGMMTCECTQ